MATEFIPRQFEALVDEYGLDDFGASGMTFQVQSLKKGKIYYEEDPRYISGHQKGVVIDDNGCWWYYGNNSFKQRFKEVTLQEQRNEKIESIIDGTK